MDRSDAWRASATRDGARTAPTIALSWYSGINLDRLATMRAASQVDLAWREDAIGFRAHELASYVTLDTYYPSWATMTCSSRRMITVFPLLPSTKK